METNELRVTSQGLSAEVMVPLLRGYWCSLECELVRSKCVFCEVTFCLGGWRLSSIMQSLFTLFFDVDLKDW